MMIKENKNRQEERYSYCFFKKLFIEIYSFLVHNVESFKKEYLFFMFRKKKL